MSEEDDLQQRSLGKETTAWDTSDQINQANNLIILLKVEVCILIENLTYRELNFKQLLT